MTNTTVQVMEDSTRGFFDSLPTGAHIRTRLCTDCEHAPITRGVIRCENCKRLRRNEHVRYMRDTYAANRARRIGRESYERAMGEVHPDNREDAN